MRSNFMIYGSYGYTGDLIARLAVERGHRPILAGRNIPAVAEQAAKLGLEYRAFDLRDTETLDKTLLQVAAVLHCAGPFINTSLPVVEACFRTGTHYLDIAGEIPVYEMISTVASDAKRVGITLLPGVGFDVVPTDSLAAHLKRRLPSAKHLALSFTSQGRSRLSRGTYATSVEMLPYGGKVRKNGELKTVPLGSKTRRIDFGSGPRKATLAPWGDVFTAYYSTGIPNIEDYVIYPRGAGAKLFAYRMLRPLFFWSVVRNYAKRSINSRPPGPTEQERSTTRTIVWGEVTDDRGRKAVSRLEGPETYAWTAITALGAVERVLARSVPFGFQTPSLALGPDFVLECGDVKRTDVV